MPFVLDVSVAMAWCFDDETTPETEAVLDRFKDDTAAVPNLWELDLANVVLVAERRRRLAEFQVTRFIDLMHRLPITVEVAPADSTSVLAAARRHDLSAYEAAYLVLAEREGLPLATRDERLLAAARAAGVPLLIEHAST
ncbi:MAG: type II toxin-antitoxin system VapC family toxin [Jiangellaceae bacterium]